jgi:hypothetical protein
LIDFVLHGVKPFADEGQGEPVPDIVCGKVGMMIAQKHMLAVLLGCLALAGSGCQSWMTANKPPVEEVKKNIFDFDGIPAREYLVGGGYKISYRARVEGDLYLADEASNRLLATISLQPGEEHEMEYDVNDEKLAANLESLGIDPKKAQFKLYFVPR